MVPKTGGALNYNPQYPTAGLLVCAGVCLCAVSGCVCAFRITVLPDKILRRISTLILIIIIIIIIIIIM